MPDTSSEIPSLLSQPKYRLPVLDVEFYTYYILEQQMVFYKQNKNHDLDSSGLLKSYLEILTFLLVSLDVFQCNLNTELYLLLLKSLFVIVRVSHSTLTMLFLHSVLLPYSGRICYDFPVI